MFCDHKWDRENKEKGPNIKNKTLIKIYYIYCIMTDRPKDKVSCILDK